MPVPPGGNPRVTDIPSANENIVIWVQIEHIDAVNVIDEIVHVPGLAGVFISTFDLSGSMGMLGRTSHPDVQSTVIKVIKATPKAGLSLGMAGLADPKTAKKWIDEGITFITLGSDQGYLVKVSQAVVSDTRKLIGK